MGKGDGPSAPDWVGAQPPAPLWVPGKGGWTLRWTGDGQGGPEYGPSYRRRPQDRAGRQLRTGSSSWAWQCLDLAGVFARGHVFLPPTVFIRRCIIFLCAHTLSHTWGNFSENPGLAV